MDPKTIDNLGTKTSSRWAKDQEQYDANLINEASHVAPQSQIDVTLPSYQSELETLIGSKRKKEYFADFFAPRGYNEQKSRLFTSRIMPALATDDRAEAQLERVKHTDASVTDKDRLEALITTVTKFNKIIIEINSRRNQYSKG